MSNILGKVYIDKEDKGVQAELQDIIAEQESPSITDKINENYKMLKRVKQRRLKQGKGISQIPIISSQAMYGQHHN